MGDKSRAGALKFRRPQVEPRAASLMVRQLFETMVDERVTLRGLAFGIDMTPTAVSCWKCGRRTPDAMSLEAAAEALGYEWKLVKKGE